MSDSLGTATGRIRIDTSDVRRAQQEVQSASRTMTQALQTLGLAVGAAQIGRFVTEADALATAYRRQRVAAINLAGSQGQLNDFLRVYEKATGGAISQTQSLTNVTKLMAVGFADDADELDKFSRAIRGISVAMGTTQDFVTQNLILELFTQRGMRLDQLGLQYDLVKQRADELAAADSSLTQQMAYQIAVLEQANERYGALTDSIEGQATGVEKLRKAWADLQLQFGQGASGGVGLIFEQWANDIERARRELEMFFNLVAQLERFRQDFQVSIGLNKPPSGMAAPPMGPRVGPSFVPRTADAASAPRFDREQLDAIVEWSRGVQEIERQAARDRLDATNQFEQQRTNAIRQYEKTIAREAEDFARQRARAIEDFGRGISIMQRDAARREALQAEDLARHMAQVRADAAERAAERQQQFDERIAESRTDSAERLAEIEEDFNKRRERAMRDHSDKLRDAAARLDAVAVRAAQRDFARSRREAEEDHREQLEKERESLQERIDEAVKAHAKQNEDEAKSLDKRIRQAQEAHDLQLRRAREADEQRLEDMQADFARRLEREDEDRRIRLERLAIDHADQLAEMARAHGERLQQIEDHAREERQLLDDEFEKEMAELGIRTNAYRLKVQEYEKAATEAFDRWWEHVNNQIIAAGNFGPQPGNPMITPGQFPSLTPQAPAYNPVPGWQRSTPTTVNITVNEAARPGQTKQEVYEAMLEFYEGGVQQ